MPDKYRTFRDGAFNVSAIEIEPGRAVPNDWNTWLVETWAERKARRAVEKAAAEIRAQHRMNQGAARVR